MLNIFRYRIDRSSRLRKDLEFYLRKLIINGHVLDIGGAQKPIINRVSVSSEFISYHILDINEAKGAFRTNYKLDIQSQSFNNTLVNLEFDHIFCTEVFFYLNDPMQALRNIKLIMSEKTILYVNFMQFFANQRPEGTDLLRYSFDWVQTAAEALGLEIIEVVPSKILRVSGILLKIIYILERNRVNKNYHFQLCSSFFVKIRLSRV